MKDPDRLVADWFCTWLRACFYLSTVYAGWVLMTTLSSIEKIGTQCVCQLSLRWSFIESWKFILILTCNWQPAALREPRLKNSDVSQAQRLCGWFGIEPNCTNSVQFTLGKKKIKNVSTFLVQWLHTQLVFSENIHLNFSYDNYITR